MKSAYRRYYSIGLAILLALSAYPVTMGLRIVFLYLRDGGIRPEDYARYVIPYAALCFSVLAAAALYPVLSRLKRFSLPAATVLAIVLFIGMELRMEGIAFSAPAARLISGESFTAQTAVDWQLSSCFVSPDAIQAFRVSSSNDASGFGSVFMRPYDNAFRIHYFLVSFVIIALVMSVFYGYGKLCSGGDGRRRVPLLLELCSVSLLLALCVLANFTGFFRSTEQYQLPLPSLLTCLFFVILGAAAGVWLGSKLIGRKAALSVWLPAVFASAVCAAMYYGEYNLLAGTLYRFGDSFLFRGLPGIVLAPVDALIILFAGAAAYFVMGRAGKAYCRRAAARIYL